jgi:hypothetical protein
MATYQVVLSAPVFVRYIPKTLLISNSINIIKTIAPFRKKGKGPCIINSGLTFNHETHEKKTTAKEGKRVFSHQNLCVLRG